MHRGVEVARIDSTPNLRWTLLQYIDVSSERKLPVENPDNTKQ